MCSLRVGFIRDPGKWATPARGQSLGAPIPVPLPPHPPTPVKPRTTPETKSVSDIIGLCSQAEPSGGHILQNVPLPRPPGSHRSRHPSPVLIRAGAQPHWPLQVLGLRELPTPPCPFHPATATRGAGAGGKSVVGAQRLTPADAAGCADKRFIGSLVTARQTGRSGRTQQKSPKTQTSPNSEGGKKKDHRFLRCGSDPGRWEAAGADGAEPGWRNEFA